MMSRHAAGYLLPLYCFFLLLMVLLPMLIMIRGAAFTSFSKPHPLHYPSDPFEVFGGIN